ncbi:MAG: ABC transporter substrate-binding protein, partial [Chloroflexi bacterium]|nr:ABC transporter substrate-binding protein [Chloroflexota bacterium]
GSAAAAATAKPAATVAAAATSTPKPAGGAMGGPSGSLVRAFNVLESVYGIGYVGPYRDSATNQIGGIEEPLFNYQNGNPMTPFLIDTWDIDSAGTRARMTLKKGLKWQSPRGYENKKFGELNATELAEWFNRSNATTNPDSTYGDAGDFAAIFLEAKAVDAYTVEVGLVAPVYYCLPVSQFGCLSAARGVHKVTHADTEGIEWARAHHVGTGPFIQGDCTPGDRCTMHAVSEHWNRVSNVASITGIQVPDTTVQISMLKNGQIDMTVLDYKLLPDVVAQGFTFLETMPGGFVGQSILFSGLLWEHSHARTAEPLEPWKAAPYAVDYPWIGNPWGHQGGTCTNGDGLGRALCGNAPYTDTNNPVGMDDMEQSRLVRLALSTAIDRGAINESLLNNIGTPIYSEYMGPEYPGWDATRTTGCWDWIGGKITCSGTQQNVKWELADGDLATAGNLLTAAGYPLVGGKRQGFGKLTLQAYAAEAGPVGLEVADTIMSDWARLGIEIEGLIEDYGGVISPRMRQRVQFLPVLKNGDVHSNVYPLDWPLPTVDTSSSRPGWGVGFESQAGAKWLFEILGEKDANVRGVKHLTWVDYSMYWLQYAGVFQVPKGIVVNSRIKSWDGYQQHYSNVSGNPELIVLK